jgi:hypothetical protein
VQDTSTLSPAVRPLPAPVLLRAPKFFSVPAVVVGGHQGVGQLLATERQSACSVGWWLMAGAGLL